MSSTATSSSMEPLTTFTWTPKADQGSNYGLKPQIILDLFADYDPNLVVTELSCELGTKFGDNYACTIYRVNVTTQVAKSHESAVTNPSTHNLIVKLLPSDPGRAAFVTGLGSFVHETTMYGKVLPELMRFQKQVGIMEEDLWSDFPLYYGSMVDGKGDYLAVENLSPSGYKMANRCLGLDTRHCKVVMQSLGKFHAISYARFKGDGAAILKAYPELAECAWKDSGSPGYEINLAWVEQSVQMLKAELREGGYGLAAQLLEDSGLTPNKICQQIYNFVTKSGPHAVIGHGDTWTNNLLFKYMDGKPVAMNLIDWQISRVCSRTIDLGYFFVALTEAGYDLKVEEDYLTIYYNAFANHATKLGFFNAEVLTFDQLKAEYAEFRLYGFLAALVIFPVVYGDEKKATDPNEMFEETGKPAEEGSKVGTFFGGCLDSNALERLSKLVTVQVPLANL